ncbi:MAG TPA: hypothetical protein VMA32_10970 [Streptosporangiaceae bacterium]|nr:hypothetical protein [Streptosporangiaceae bacterium]
MSGLRVAVSAVLGAAGLVLAMVSPALAASAQVNITILSAGPDGSGDPYNLTVTASDTNGTGGTQITSMTAHVFSASMQDVADPTMTYVSGPTSDQVWVANPPIAETSLPAGTYTVTVDASDGTESDLGLPAPGSFQFSYATSSLSVIASPSSVTQGSQSVTFSGTLTGTAPGGTPVGIANAPVNLAGAASNPVATTNSAGFFSYAATGVAPATYSFSVAAVANVYPAASNTVTVTAVQATTSMTVTPSPASVTEGLQTVTFSGTVTATPPAPASPVGVGSGVPVYMSVAGGAPAVVTHTTDANGDFSVSEMNVAPATTYAFSVNSTVLYTAASVSTQVTAVAAPTTIAVTPSPGVVTFGSPNVTFNGTVTALPQGSTTAVPVPGAPVYLNGSSSPVATTDSNGKFSYAATGVTQDVTETFTVPASSAGLYSSGTDAVPVDVDPGTTAMTVTANPPDINLATSTVTFNGTVSVTPFGGSTAQGAGSGIPVYLSVGGGAATQVTTTSDASGDFSYTATGVTAAADYDFSVKSATYSTAASESVPIGQNQVQSTLSVTPTPASVTEGSQDVTFSGQLTGVSPSGGPSVAIQNAPVSLSVNGGASTGIGSTDANGDFTYKVSGLSQKTTYDFSIASSTNYTQATNDIAVVVDQARTRITHVRVTPADLKYGQNATLRATVQYLSGATWTALPGVTVHLAEGKTSLHAVTAGSSGGFTATLPSTHGPGWTAVVNAGKLTLQASATGNLSIALPLEVRSFAASLGVNDKISTSGCLEVISPTGHGPGTSVDIQYASGAGGPWRSLGTLPLNNGTGRNRTCRSNDQSYFSGKLPAKLSNAYYRADFAATASYQAAVSKVIHAWKYPTRIVSFTASKHTISKNGTVRFRGRLEVHVKSWQGWGGQKVAIWYNYKGTSIWQQLTRTPATTNSRGYFSTSANGSAGNFVAINYAIYAGNSTHLACMSKGVAVRISNDKVAVDDAPTVSATLAPPSLDQIDPLPALGVPMLPAFAAAPSIASLARRES